MSGKANIWQRRKARRALVQAVYQWQLAGSPARALVAEFAASDALKKADSEFFEAILQGVIGDVQQLDELLTPHLDRSIGALDQIERAILRLAVFELRGRIDVPYRVVIDEYVELAKTFGAQDGHKYVNGVIDKLAAQLRKLEVEAGE